MQVNIKNLFPREVVLLKTAWARIKGVNSHENDFEHIPEPHDFVEVQATTQETQNA